MNTGGRPVGANTLFAREHGITRQKVWRLGGAARLRAMTPEVRAFILGDKGPGKSGKELRRGGLAARGMSRRKRT